MNVILEGIVGSHAYGLAHEDSDIDYRGVYVHDTVSLFGLSKPKDTRETKDPDRVMHEVEKFLRLALNANPNIIELLYLPEYDILEDVGDTLVEYRGVFASQRAVQTYGGYAVSQLQKMKRLQRADRKHARHCLRLLRQGRQYITEGTITLKVDDPEEYFRMNDMSLDEVITVLEHELDRFNLVIPQVPPHPDVEFVDEFLVGIRGAYLDKRFLM